MDELTNNIMEEVMKRLGAGTAPTPVTEEK